MCVGAMLPFDHPHGVGSRTVQRTKREMEEGRPLASDEAAQRMIAEILREVTHRFGGAGRRRAFARSHSAVYSDFLRLIERRKRARRRVLCQKLATAADHDPGAGQP
jgi:hypothetical protein